MQKVQGKAEGNVVFSEGNAIIHAHEGLDANQHEQGFEEGRIASGNKRKGDLENGCQGVMHQSARDYGICHSRRRIGGHSHTCDNDFQAQAGRALECDRNRDKRIVISLDELVDRLRPASISERFGFGLAKQTERYYRDLLYGFKDTKAQSTVEYAIVMGALLLIVVVLGMLASVIQDNLFIEHAVSSASHNVSGALGAIVDVFIY